jgi:transposase
VTIPPELEAQILRYYHVEKWLTGTIARQLRLHPETVARVLAQAGLPRIGGMQRPSKVDPYLPFILETLGKFPTLTASRLYGMVWERGYRGGKSRFRAVVACHRPRRTAEAYLRLRTLPAEQAQCDWGHFGKMVIGRARRPLMAFVMVLSYSRQIFLRFFLNARMENFLGGHLGAFTAWQGIPRVILYDNLRSAVLERHGDAIRFNPALLSFAAHYRFEPRPVALARGNEKGRVERAIRFVRDAFFAARTFTDLDDLNTQADAWCRGPAADRRCPEDQTLVESKQRARRHRAADRLARAAPASRALLIAAAERGNNLGNITAALLQLLERYGPRQLDAAIVEALERDVPHPTAVRVALERRRDEQRQAPPVAIILPPHIQARDKAVQPHSLDIYDRLSRGTPAENGSGQDQEGDA